MPEIQLATVGVALLSLIFSEFPFIQLVYFLAAVNLIDWDQWGLTTVIMLFALIGATMFKRVRS